MKNKDYDNKNKFRQVVYKDITKKWVFLNSFFVLYVMGMTVVFIIVPIANKEILGALIGTYTACLFQLLKEGETIWTMISLLFKRLFRIGRNSKKNRKGGKDD